MHACELECPCPRAASRGDRAARRGSGVCEMTALTTQTARWRARTSTGSRRSRGRRLVCVSIRTSTSTGTHPRTRWTSDDPRWQLDPETDPLAATDWYAEQPLRAAHRHGPLDHREHAQGHDPVRADADPRSGALRGQTAERLAGVPVSHARADRRSPITSRCSRSSSTAPAKTFPECGEAPGSSRRSWASSAATPASSTSSACCAVNSRCTTSRRCSIAARRSVPPLLNKITYIHLAEEARHITFADDHLAQRMRACRPFQAGDVRDRLPVLSPVVDRGVDRTTAHLRPAVRDSATGLQDRLLEERSSRAG